MKSPKVEADAPAEALFWESKINDSPAFTTVWEYYIRVKIFGESGREKFGKINITVPANRKITDIRARVIKPDGSFFEIKKEDVFEQDVVKIHRKILLKSVSFAVPNLEIGSILDYTYKESALDLAIGGRPLMFQLDIPAHKISYIFKSPQKIKFTKNFFNMTEPESFKDEKGFNHITATNVPALKEEPFMPPQKEVTRWFFLSYTSDFLNLKPENFWNQTAVNSVAAYRLKEVLKPDEKIWKEAFGIIGDAETDEEKIARLYEFCQTKIKNLDYAAQIGKEEKDKIRFELGKVKPSDSVDYTLKNSRAFSLEINELFAALASSAGFETRYAFTGNRDEIFFAPKYMNADLFHFACVAVKIGDKWKYFDPAEPNVPFGMLDWKEENQNVFLVGSEKFSWDRTPLSPPEKSSIKRNGKLKLSSENTLEGEITSEYTGHSAVLLKNLLRDATVDEQKNYFIRQAAAMNNTTEIGKVEIKNLNDKTANLIVSYKVKVPKYASRTANRIFVQPDFSKFGVKSVFASAERIHPVYFNYP